MVTWRLDPFAASVALCLDAMTYGLHYVGIELEPKFVELGNKNLELWRSRYGFTAGTLCRGIAAGYERSGKSEVQAVVGSPPYAAVGMQGGSTTIGTPPRPGDVRQYPRKAPIREYGTTPGQLSNAPGGARLLAPLRWRG